MLLITCPWCGQREEPEFAYGGQAHVAYPADPQALTDPEWAQYLFFRANPKGPFAERWVHSAGCRRWFNAVRDTVTNEFVSVNQPGVNQPGVKESGVNQPGVKQPGVDQPGVQHPGVYRAQEQT